MDTSFKPYNKLWIIPLFLILSGNVQGQKVETRDLLTSEVQTIRTSLGNASLIQLPIEPTATFVGHPSDWMVEKQGKLVSVKPISPDAGETNFAVVTPRGTLNFHLKQVEKESEFDQMLRITSIQDDSRPITTTPPSTPSDPVETLTRELQICHNYHALRLGNSPILHGVEQKTILTPFDIEGLEGNFLQTFRFQDSGHLVLHFTLKNVTDSNVSLAPRKTVVSVNDTLFLPTAVSLGNNTVRIGTTTENFVILDGSNGLSPQNTFNIHLYP